MVRLIPALASLLLVAPAAPGTAQNISTPGSRSPANAGGNATVNYASMTSEEKAAFARQIANILVEAAGKKGEPVVGPSVDQQFDQALTAVVQGASEGDKRLQKALTLLVEGSVAQATPLLQAFAEEKTARIGRDLKEAAMAYRSLGAIGRLQDPDKALEAYAKAAELDPNDVESLYWAGNLELEHGDLDSAERRLRLVLARTPGQDQYQYWSQVRLGDIAMRRNDRVAALASYQAALAIAKRLKADPGSAEGSSVQAAESRRVDLEPRSEQFIARSVHAPLFARMSYNGFSRIEALAIAKQEWRLFGQPVYDGPPHTGSGEANDVPERSPGAWERIGEYWWLGQDADRRESMWTGMHDESGQETEDGQDDYAWSAAFISYVMRTAGAGARFPYAPSHYIYIDIAKAMKLGHTSGWALVAERVDAYAPVPGDLICFWRGSKPLTFDELPAPRFAAHCDIVVSREPEQISVIGGNVNHAVTMKHVPVTLDGRLATSENRVLDARYPWFVVLHVLYDR
ncbi:MAG TPA: DUF2272 domain-containing protein [Rhodopila sp.]|nr:DUF2272 domain-containing protein [Rhodopila sp.]